MSKVKAKFYVESVIPTSDESRQIGMRAVIGNSEENKDWSKWTPSGDLSLSVTTEAFKDAKVGDEYYLTFEKAE